MKLESVHKIIKKWQSRSDKFEKIKKKKEIKCGQIKNASKNIVVSFGITICDTNDPLTY